VASVQCSLLVCTTDVLACGLIYQKWPDAGAAAAGVKVRQMPTVNRQCHVLLSSAADKSLYQGISSSFCLFSRL